MVFYGNLRFRQSVLAVGLEDDFFYYAQAARNLAFAGSSSFDGIHRTNGYHPLWMLVLTGLTKLFGIGGLFHPSTVFPFAVALETVQFALVLGIAYFTYRLCRLFCGVAASICVQLLIASWALILVRTGMEVGLALTVSIGLLFFRLRKGFTWSSKTCVLYGLLAALMVLSRLDSILLVALLFCFDILPNSGHGIGRLRRCALFFANMWPLAIYFFINEWRFHTLMPISGTAKQLRAHHIPSLWTLRSFAGFIAAKNSPLLGPAILITTIAIVLLLIQTVRMRKNRGVLISALIFPGIHLLLISSLSDWPLWQWYLYPWLISAVVAAAIILERDPRRAKTNSWVDHKASVYLCSAYLIAYGLVVASRSNPQNNLPYVAGIEIEGFAKKHPGLYAMGDRAGSVAYLSDSPVLQLEGLMMDKDYLNNIRQGRDLLQVLHEYGVHYYIATRAALGKDGCWTAKEPFQAGEDSPAMMGHICKKPIAVMSHGVFVNEIFDLQSPDLSIQGN